jgi:hypothetical protein
MGNRRSPFLANEKSTSTNKGKNRIKKIKAT